MIEQTKLARKQSRSAKLPTQRIGTIEHSTDGTVPEERHPQNFSALSCVRNNSAGHEYQWATTVGRRGTRCPFHIVDVEIPGPVIDPPEVMAAAEITKPLAGSSCDHRVGGAEENHPVATQLNGFLARYTPRPRRWRLRSHRSSLHHTTVTDP